MIIVIDGYNVLKPAAHRGQVTDRQRLRFIHEVNAYARKRGHHVYVIFDGYDSIDDHEMKKKAGVFVVYSGKQTADDVIKYKIEQFKGREVVVVTSDRELCRYAERHGMESVDSSDFYRIIKLDHEHDSHASRQEQAIKMHQNEEHAELDALMQDVVVRPKDELGSGEVLESGKKRSKHERKLARILKKL